MTRLQPTHWVSKLTVAVWSGTRSRQLQAPWTHGPRRPRPTWLHQINHAVMVKAVTGENRTCSPFWPLPAWRRSAAGPRCSSLRDCFLLYYILRSLFAQLRGMLSGDDASKEQVEKQILNIWDKMYTTWFAKVCLCLRSCFAKKIVAVKLLTFFSFVFL